MNETRSGFYWHVHHDVLMEWSGDIQERVNYIKVNKLAKEIKTRLRLMKPVAGPLPSGLIKAQVVHEKAWGAYEKARARAHAALACLAERNRAWAAHDKAQAACAKSQVVLSRALVVYRDDALALHAIECPGCPWDGHTIFPGKDVK